MQKRYAVAIVLGLAIAAPFHAQAAQNTQSGGSVCGRVDAPALAIFRLQQSPTHDNVIVARSSTGDELRTTVNLDGSYCFTGLKNEIYTLDAFEDGMPQYSASVTPQDGKTVVVDLFAERK